MAVLHTSAEDRNRLGLELRRLRELAGKTLQDAAARLHCSAAKVSRMETGHVSVRPLDMREILDCYGVGGAQRAALLSVVQQQHERGWWREYLDVIYSGYDLYVGYEETATEIWEYQPQWIPGMLQTHGYASALGSACGMDQDTANRLADLRLARQLALLGENPPRLSVVIDDSALLRSVAQPGLMRDQLLQLARSAQTPGHTVRILPSTAGMHPGQTGGFIVLGFADAADPRVAYTNNLTAGQLIREPEQVSRYVWAYHRLTELALSPDESAGLIKELAEKHD
jgi:transcriptional regulator with XRE-family HTH domain